MKETTREGWAAELQERVGGHHHKLQWRSRLGTKYNDTRETAVAHCLEFVSFHKDQGKPRNMYINTRCMAKLSQVEGHGVNRPCVQHHIPPELAIFVDILDSAAVI